MPNFTRHLIPLAAGALVCGAAVAAPVPAFDAGNHLDGGSNGYTLSGTVNNYTLGFRFTTTQTLQVTELGTWDPQGTGPGTQRQVGLFEFAAGSWNLLASTHFQASQPAVHRQGSYSYRDIADIQLLVGHTYAILTSGYHGGAQSPLYLRQHATLAGINYGSGLYGVTNNTSDAFAGPNFSSYNLGPEYYTYMGGNFLWDAVGAGVPEPGSLALAALALGLLGSGRRRAAR